MSPKHLLRGLKRPKQIEFTHDVNQPGYGKFSAEPFERSFGVTVGNSLRRTLMSSIEGAAITAVKIEGVSHEFATIEGILEDVTRIILNLKMVRVTFEVENRDEPKVIHFEKKGAGVFRAAELAVDSSIQILTPDLHIATLNDDASLVMDLQFEKGRGYIPAEILKKNIDEIGTIPVDAMFSPISRVNFYVSETRVGQRTDYEKLTIEIWTDGSIAPDDALAQAAKIFKEHLTVFINFDEEPEEEEEETDEIEENLRQNLEKHVEELEISVRSLSVLKSLEIDVLAELVKRNEEELQKSRHYSEQGLQEIKQRLTELNLEFGMRDFLAPRE